LARIRPLPTTASSGDLPAWLTQLAGAAGGLRGEDLSRFTPPRGRELRSSAVLVLFGDGPEGPDVLLIERAATLRDHAGQPAFPGGVADPGDGGPLGTALREAAEETGLLAAGVAPFAVLPAQWLPVSDFAVVPVLGWWREQSLVRAVNAAEVATVVRAPLAKLVDPACRGSVRHPSGFTSPAFEIEGLLVWGFTAGLLDRLLEIGGWSTPWDATRYIALPG